MKLVQGAALALSLLGAAPSLALPVISEVFYDATGVDDGLSFVELYGAPGAGLDGLVIEAVNGADGAVTHTLTLTGSFGADGLFVVADRTSAGATQVADADLLLDFDFQNGDQKQAKSRGYGATTEGLGRSCASTQGRMCRLLCQLRVRCRLEEGFCRWAVPTAGRASTEACWPRERGSGGSPSHPSGSGLPRRDHRLQGVSASGRAAGWDRGRARLCPNPESSRPAREFGPRLRPRG